MEVKLDLLLFEHSRGYVREGLLHVAVRTPLSESLTQCDINQPREATVIYTYLQVPSHSVATSHVERLGVDRHYRISGSSRYVVLLRCNLFSLA